MIITSYNTLEPLLPEELRELYRTGDTRLLALLPLNLMRRVRIIPASGASGSAMFIGFIPDRVNAGRHESAEACLAVAAGGDESRSFGGANGIAPALFG